MRIAAVRASETVGLKVGDIDSGRGIIRVRHGKGGKDRTVMLSAQLLRILRVYWRLAKPQGWLFPGRSSTRPIDVQVLYSACRSARIAAGIDKRVTVHTLRHSFATHLLENGTDTRLSSVRGGEDAMMPYGYECDQLKRYTATGIAHDEDGRWLSQRDVARFLVLVAEAGEDCRAKLAAVRRLIESQG